MEKVNVQLNNGTVDVEFNNDVDVQKITDTIEDQGYSVGGLI
ncbi:MAG TPA: hypothetical protein VI423_08630 [Paenisporosarcina sp.]|nr:hypothetical protein [Paenisporosarcina sp.]